MLLLRHACMRYWIVFNFQGAFTLRARRTAPRSAASNSEIETGAIRAAKSDGAVRRTARCCSHYARQRNDSASCACSAVRRRAAPWLAAPCGADGAQTGAALLRCDWMPLQDWIRKTCKNLDNFKQQFDLYNQSDIEKKLLLRCP